MNSGNSICHNICQQKDIFYQWIEDKYLTVLLKRNWGIGVTIQQFDLEYLNKYSRSYNDLRKC